MGFTPDVNFNENTSFLKVLTYLKTYNFKIFKDRVRKDILQDYERIF